MKLSVIGPVFPYRGGISHFNSAMISALTSAGHNIQSISFIRQYIQWLYPGKTDQESSNNAIKVTSSFLLDPVKFWTWRTTINQIRNFNPDSIIFEWWTTFWAIPFAYMLSRLKTSKTILIIHNALPHEQKPYDRFLTKLVFSQANLFITLSEHEKEQLLNQGIPEKHVFTIEHPIYDNLLNLKTDQNTARNNLQLSNHKKILLFFGFIRPYKGLDILLEAFSQLDLDEYFLIIAGESWTTDNPYKRFIENHDLDSNILYLDRYVSNEEAACLFSAADIFVAPYIGGTQSGAIKMAMGFNLPIITTNVIASTELANNYPNIKIIPSNNTEALEKAIKDWKPKQELTNLPDGYTWRFFSDNLTRIVSQGEL
jgi:glycosyltransferase involved in cell wall biosynthesis